MRFCLAGLWPGWQGLPATGSDPALGRRDDCWPRLDSACPSGICFLAALAGNGRGSAVWRRDDYAAGRTGKGMADTSTIFVHAALSGNNYRSRNDS